MRLGPYGDLLHEVRKDRDAYDEQVASTILVDDKPCQTFDRLLCQAMALAALDLLVPVSI